MITTDDIEIFIEGTKHYFHTSTDKQVSLETPYLVGTDEIKVSDYTGIIGVSGGRKGFVIVTSPTELLRYLVLSLGEKDATEDLIRDVIGEVANTISGNARRSFGSGFMISVPIIVKGRPDSIGSVRDVNGYVIPFRWNSFPFQLIVALE